MTSSMLVRRIRKVLNETVATSRAMRYIFDDLPLADLMACDEVVLQAIESLTLAASKIRIALFAIEKAGANQRTQSQEDVQ